jgi:hypothetical protein
VDAEGGRGVFFKLVIYDVLGCEVVVIAEGQFKPGNYEVTWDASNYPSGMYFYKISAGDYSDSRKMILLK